MRVVVSHLDSPAGSFAFVSLGQCLSCAAPSALTVAVDVVLVLGRLGAAATLRHLLVVSGQQSFNL